MAATIQIHRLTGAGPSNVDITSTTTRSSYSDAASPGTSDPVPIPPSGTNYAWWVNTRLNCTVLPDGTVNNLKWYTNTASNPYTGIDLAVGTTTAANYTQATGQSGAGTSGTILNSTNYTGLTPTTPSDNAWGYGAGAPLSVSGSVSSGGSTGLFGDLVVYQHSVDNTASAGAAAAETITWQYDET